MDLFRSEGFPHICSTRPPLRRLRRSRAAAEQQSSSSRVAAEQQQSSSRAAAEQQQSSRRAAPEQQRAAASSSEQAASNSEQQRAAVSSSRSRAAGAEQQQQSSSSRAAAATMIAMAKLSCTQPDGTMTQCNTFGSLVTRRIMFAIIFLNNLPCCPGQLMANVWFCLHNERFVNDFSCCVRRGARYITSCFRFAHCFIVLRVTEWRDTHSIDMCASNISYLLRLCTSAFRVHARSQRLLVRRA